MNFGKWIKQQREFSQLDGYRLAFKSGLTQSTISRIENEKIDPALETAYQLAKVFEFDGRKIYRVLSVDEKNDSGLDVRSFFQSDDYKPSSIQSQVEKKQGVDNLYEFPTITDLEKIKELSKINITLLEEQFLNLVNRVNEKLVKEITAENIELQNIVYQPKIYFTNLPLSTSHLDYPEQENEHVFQEIIAQNGAVIIDDFYSYVDIKLKSIESIELDFNDKTTIERLESMSSSKELLGKIKLSTIFKWDQILSCNGDLFDLAWKTIEYDFSKNYGIFPIYDVDPGKVSYSFLILSRWLASLNIKTTWKSDFKRIVLKNN